MPSTNISPYHTGYFVFSAYMDPQGGMRMFEGVLHTRVTSDQSQSSLKGGRTVVHDEAC